MNDRVREQISALMDDELAAEEREMLLRRMAEDRSLLEQWERYHLIRDVLHHEAPDRVGGGLADRVARALDQEPQTLAQARRRSLPTRVLKPLAGLAIAASVAGLAVIGLREFALPGRSIEPATPVASSPAPERFTVAGTRWDQRSPQVEARLNGYLVNHNEYTSAGFQGMLHYTRIAGYDVQQ